MRAGLPTWGPTNPCRAAPAVGKVLRSPATSIFALLAFSASVALAVARIRAARAWAAIAGKVQQLLRALRGGRGGSDFGAPAPALA